MVDIIIAFVAAISVPTYILLIRGQQSSLGVGAGLIAALSGVEPGGLPMGILLLLLAHVLASTLVWKAVGLYYVYWYFRDWYSTKESVLDAVEFTSTLPVSPLMQRKLRRSIIMQYFIRVVWPKHDERLRQQGLL